MKGSARWFGGELGSWGGEGVEGGGEGRGEWWIGDVFV